MVAFPAGVKVRIAGGVTDMQCGMNSLALKVQQGLGCDMDLHRFRSSLGGTIRLSS
jgi:transposase